jgi:hypothetical protein
MEEFELPWLHGSFTSSAKRMKEQEMATRSSQEREILTTITTNVRQLASAHIMEVVPMKNFNGNMLKGIAFRINCWIMNHIEPNWTIIAVRQGSILCTWNGQSLHKLTKVLPHRM